MMRGFHNPFRVEYQVVNLARLQELAEDVTAVTPITLAALRVVRHADKPIKVLGEGEISRPLQVKATKFSSSARAKIEAAGGSVLEG
jgi:large subunit ribosomal protein L15